MQMTTLLLTARLAGISGLAGLTLLVLATHPAGAGQRGASANSRSSLPEAPVAVPLPEISEEVVGPGATYESVLSLPPGQDLAHFSYEGREYFVSGTAAAMPYQTRIVVRRPLVDEDFSGLVLVEAMHPSGSAHLFEYTSSYLMDSGHIAVEILTSGLGQIIEFNPSRYADLRVDPDQISDVIAQVGALLREGGARSPIPEPRFRKMVLAGTSATAGILIRYLPAHRVYRTPEMRQIYDGFLPHANGATIPPIDVPLIQVPTMTEVANGDVTPRPDGDRPGEQFRLYEFAAMAHIDTRDNIRHRPDPCTIPVSSFPLQAYVSIALHHLFEWVDKGTLPPRAPRILVDRNVDNDGSIMSLDPYGNALGGVRNTYVDVPTSKLGVPNEAADPPISNPGAYIAAMGQAGANQMCRLAGYKEDFTRDQLREIYGSPEVYRREVRARLDALEAEGWSLPIYRDIILGDAARVDF